MLDAGATVQYQNAHVMNEPDNNDEQRIERIREEGECVHSIHFDGGVPGANGVFSIYKFENEYWYDEDGVLQGPFETYDEIMELIDDMSDAT